MSSKESFVTRPYAYGDRNFIFASWLKGMYYGSPYHSEIPKNIFMENMHRILEAFLAKPGVNIRVACLKSEPDVILGYSVFHIVAETVTVLDWVFVKSNFRKIGIAKALVPSDIRAYTHLTKLASSITKIKYQHLVYNPFIFY